MALWLTVVFCRLFTPVSVYVGSAHYDVHFLAQSIEHKQAWRRLVTSLKPGTIVKRNIS